MLAIKKQLKQNLALFLLISLLPAIPAMAATDLEAQESFLRMRAKSETGHAAHKPPIDKSMDFHGVFYGFLPCKDCAGIKATLSLKQRNNYLLVTQSAKESSREFYEKGKYTWNEEKQTVVLTPKKGGESTRHYRIKNEGTLVQINDDGSMISNDDADSYVLKRSDMVKSREVHFH
ncbi:MAG: copper resistance protein NlpE [Methylicorpusculum sp.]|uniref:copper resistance protein NlpE n=1 Tax=Methylicorpusculum sp. TaxID=2713644 RepID=UPI00271E6983|nr:copper resistance protein NlpE [Methylicorpusculum sp.]MDO8842841.1 copper resistance protein NlpE [Methylicorpusculum sp.]MDO8937702.1 copper resistance protein NlpE [Methylicorpusculum sp.]MDO9238980.1 copper resistance protein NlpE [Methylicorpusculum sp.]MDP2180020.1 copper resistance protein NlpE [Methylicorpusculum sp.]MDP2202836.1 copper resistance protein NlpE [Methylicorpusculum sp.]